MLCRLALQTWATLMMFGNGKMHRNEIFVCHLKGCALENVILPQKLIQNNNTSYY